MKQASVTMAKPKRKSYWRLSLTIIICEIAVLVGGLVSGADTNVWYSAITKPSWTPPSYFFGPIWIFLYLLMGVSLWMVWESQAADAKKVTAELCFAIQLFLNFCWSVVFFRFHSPSIALIIIGFLVVIVFMTLYQFKSISRTAAWLIIPYLCWLSFVTVINYSIWDLNRSEIIQTPILHHDGQSPNGK